MVSSIYTGREIAIFTDCFGMGIPLYYILEDIKKRGITEIYSLGNAIGLGPNSDMVIDMFEENNVKAIAGVIENYFKLGINSCGGIDRRYLESYYWLKNILGVNRINYISFLNPSINASIGNKQIGLCSFANDVRISSSYIKEYTRFFDNGISCDKFYETNNQYFMKCKEDVTRGYLNNSSLCDIYLNINSNPMFNGKVILTYDDIIQGSTGRRYFETDDKTNFHSFAPVCFDDKGNLFPYATYYILREKTRGGFDIQTVAVPYDFDMMKDDILNSKEPSGMVKKMILRK